MFIPSMLVTSIFVFIWWILVCYANVDQFLSPHLFLLYFFSSISSWFCFFPFVYVLFLPNTCNYMTFLAIIALSRRYLILSYSLILLLSVVSFASVFVLSIVATCSLLNCFQHTSPLLYLLYIHAWFLICLLEPRVLSETTSLP